MPGAFSPGFSTGFGAPSSGIQPATATLTVSRFAPAPALAWTTTALAPGSATLSVSSSAPIILVSSIVGGAYDEAFSDAFDIGVVSQPGVTTVLPGTAQITLAGRAPSIPQSAKTVAPAAAVLSLTRFAPTIGGLNVSPAPSAATLAVAGRAPSVAIATVLVRPPVRALTLQAFAPGIARSQHVAVAPAAARIGIITHPLAQSNWAALKLRTGFRLRLRGGGLLLLQVEAQVAHVKAPAARSVSAGYGLSALAWTRPLDPHEILFYTIDWAEELTGTSDSIASNGSIWELSGAAVSAGIVTTGNAHTYDSTSATVWLSVESSRRNDVRWAGSGETHQITHRVNTVGGQVLERAIGFTVKSFQG